MKYQIIFVVFLLRSARNLDNIDHIDVKLASKAKLAIKPNGENQGEQSLKENKSNKEILSKRRKFICFFKAPVTKFWINVVRRFQY